MNVIIIFDDYMNIFINALNLTCVNITIQISFITISCQIILDIMRRFESSITQVSFIEKGLFLIIININIKDKEH
jgi:hypothetical protein